MSGSRLVRLVFWFFATLASSAYGIHLYKTLPQFYVRDEAHFVNPVAREDGRLFLRSDRGGKGYFGASRNGNRLHQGIDIAGPVGTPVVATRSGRVAFSGINGGYGQYVQLVHADFFESRYAPLSDLRVAKGEWIEQGEPLGLLGATGNARSPGIMPHLHFEIRRFQKIMNPMKLIKTEGISRDKKV